MTLVVLPNRWLILLATFLWASTSTAQSAYIAEKPSNSGQTVVLLHGLARSSWSMDKLQRSLDGAGFTTCNIDYPSTEYPIERLATEFALPEIEACIGSANESVSFVTHSMGGILIRYLIRGGHLSMVNRVVMLSPPNGGSEVVDKMGDWWLFEKMNGPAGSELGTDEDALPLHLGPATFEVGILTGNHTVNPILSLMIEGRDDGKVSIENAKLEGMADFMVLPVSHPFIMRDESAIFQTIYFLQNGRFQRALGTH